MRTRQPLSAVRVKLPAAAGGRLSPDAAVNAELTGQVLDELNVKALEALDDESGMVERSLFPLLPVIGPRRGSQVGAIMAGARSGAWRVLDDGRVEAGGVVLEPDEFQLTARARPGFQVAEEGDLLVALDTELTPALEAEGLAREIGHRLQNLRKAAGYEISDRIVAAISGEGPALEQLAAHRDWLADEVLARQLTIGVDASLAEPDRSEDVELEGSTLRLAVRRA
jgi:isoleucyl-tRNA synthetase